MNEQFTSITIRENREGELNKMHDRLVGLIRSHAKKAVDANISDTKPDLYDIANEIDAFFVGLKATR